MRERIDFFGNRVVYFSIESLHESLDVTVASEIVTHPRASADIFSSISWEQAAEELRHDPRQTNRDALDARLYVLDSPFIFQSPGLADYAHSSFTPGRNLVDAVLELNQRIFSEFTYDPEFTTLATPLQDVLASKRGVCQDFAHLGIGCLRSLGLAARYVSGYMETLPPPGQQKLLGADATHAWLAVFVPGWGWLELDPTNGCVPDERYIILGWGRDFADVTPLKGVMTGGGDHSLSVAVDVLPQEEGAQGQVRDLV
jgi:transglutaminase-like putative cysteine protease